MESEALEYYIDEVKHEINLEEEEEQEPELNGKQKNTSIEITFS